jgi:hypothetical protein
LLLIDLIIQLLQNFLAVLEDQLIRMVLVVLVVQLHLGRMDQLHQLHLLVLSFL